MIFKIWCRYYVDYDFFYFTFDAESVEEAESVLNSLVNSGYEIGPKRLERVS